MRGWQAIVATSVWFGAGVGVVVGGPAGLAVAFVLVFGTLARGVIEVAQVRRRNVSAELRRRLYELLHISVEQGVASGSHDPFTLVRRDVERLARDPRPAIAAAAGRARSLIESVDMRAQSSLAFPVGDDRPAGRKPTFVGGLIAADPESGDDDVKRFGDPRHLPAGMPQPLARALTAIGRVLDDVRALHDAQIEWIVLTFTVWARMLLIALSPLLGALTFAAAPLSDGSTAAADTAWALASGWAFLVALRGPRVATLAMEESRAGMRARRLLLAVELPLACAVTVLSPAWMIAAFAAGWTNWLQRIGTDGAHPHRIPDFSWTRLALFVAAVVLAQIVGFALAGDAAPLEVAAEVAAALLAIAVIGGSYGAMLPISAGVLVQVVAGGTLARRRVDPSTRAALTEIATDIRQAAEDLTTVGADDTTVHRAAAVLKTVARDLERYESTPRETARVPRDLEALVDAALGWTDEPASRDALEQSDDGSELHVDPPSIAHELDGARIRSRRHARTISRLLVRCLHEARTHGTGALYTRIELRGDRIVFALANEAGSGPVAGRGTGEQKLERLASSLPDGRVDLRGAVTSRYIGGGGQLAFFAVEFSASQELVEHQPTEAEGR